MITWSATRFLEGNIWLQLKKPHKVELYKQPATTTSYTHIHLILSRLAPNFLTMADQIKELAEIPREFREYNLSLSWKSELIDSQSRKAHNSSTDAQSVRSLPAHLVIRDRSFTQLTAILRIHPIQSFPFVALRLNTLHILTTLHSWQAGIHQNLPGSWNWLHSHGRHWFCRQVDSYPRQQHSCIIDGLLHLTYTRDLYPKSHEMRYTIFVSKAKEYKR